MWPHSNLHAMLQAKPLHGSAKMRPSKESAHTSKTTESRYARQLTGPPAMGQPDAVKLFLPYAMLASTDIMGFLDAIATPAKIVQNAVHVGVRCGGAN